MTDIRLLNLSKGFNAIRQMNSNRLVIAQSNINSLRNKFTSLLTNDKDMIWYDNDMSTYY